MNDEPQDDAQHGASALKQITPKQWFIALIVVVAVPVCAYFGTVYGYPYATDLIEGESPITAVLAEYGVDEDAETQLLTIRKGDLINSVAVNGTLEYANREQLSFGTSGTVETIDVDVGDFVSEGDVLMTLESEAIVAAEEELQSASVALQDAEQRLEELISPDENVVTDASFKVFKAEQSLGDAEEKLSDMLEPTELEVANAELAIASAESDLEKARDRLAELQKPADIDIENARFAVAEAEKTLADLNDDMKEMTTVEDAEFIAAELAVDEAVKAAADALEDYETLLEIDESAVNKAILDIAKAEMALKESEASVADAEKGLREAEANIETGIADAQLEIAQAEADVASAELSIVQSEEALDKALQPFDEDEVADLKTKIAEAKDDIQVAEDQLEKLEIETSAEYRKLEIDLQDARDVYRDVFLKWLGMDVSEYRYRVSPDKIFADAGKTLPEIMNSVIVTGGLGWEESRTSGWVGDDSSTPWDESIVATWMEFFLTDLKFDCTDTEAGANVVCVNTEFDDAWDALVLKTEAYDTAMLAETQRFDNLEDSIESAEKLLSDLNDQLEELLEPTDDETIADLTAKLELARHKQIDARNRHEFLLSELAWTEQELKMRRDEAAQALQVAEEEVIVARDALSKAQDDLAELKAGADELELAVARSKVEKAESDMQEAIDRMAELEDVDMEEFEFLASRISTAEVDLQDKAESLNELLDGNELEIDLATAEVLAAGESWNDKVAALNDLISPDQADIDLARNEIEVAKSDLEVARDELSDLLNPNAATVALRRAEIATARENLDAAQAATEGTKVVAPFDGVIADVPINEGRTVNEREVAVVIADPSIVEISGSVDEVDVLFLQVGDSASIELEALGDEVLIGRISDIAAFGESNQGVVTYPVTIQTEQPEGTQLPEGLSAVAEVVIREQTDQLLVPIQALFGSVDEPQLLISNSDGTLEPRTVSIGISDDFWTVVESGVSEGETLLMTVVGADTSQFSGFRAISRSVAVSGGPPPGGGR